MSQQIGVLAQVPAEAQCLSTTIPSLRGLGEVVVFSAGAGDEVAAEAARLGLPVVAVPWTGHYGELFTAVARHLGDGPWLIAYADETVAEPGPGDWLRISGPVAAGVRHRTSERDTYTEENECRAVGTGGAALEFSGLVYPTLLRDGSPVPPEELPHSGVVFEHHPARWADLSPQRLARTAQVYRTALRDRPHDPELLYGLFHCHYSAHEWPQLRELASRWRGCASDDDPNHPLVDYYEACAAVAQRDAADALRLAENAVARVSAFADGWYLIGELQAAAGLPVAADEAFATAAAIGWDADPVAVEDYSLATWRAWRARAVLAKQDGRGRQAEEFMARARESRREQRAG
ncbi:MAG: tetratricopeptide repeat protein [Pseudonocardiaceae bacterium]